MQFLLKIWWHMDIRMNTSGNAMQRTLSPIHYYFDILQIYACIFHRLFNRWFKCLMVKRHTNKIRYIITNIWNTYISTHERIYIHTVKLFTAPMGNVAENILPCTMTSSLVVNGDMIYCNVIQCVGLEYKTANSRY